MTTFELLTEDAGDIRVIRIRGPVDYENAKPFNKGLLEAIDAGFRKVVLDFSQLDHINSLGITLVLGASTRVKEAGGRLVIQSPSPDVLKLLRVLRLDKVLTLAPTFEDARRFLDSQLPPPP